MLKIQIIGLLRRDSIHKKKQHGCKAREEKIEVRSVCDKQMTHLHLYISVTYRVRNVHQCHSWNSGDDQQKFLSAEIIILRSEEKTGKPARNSA